ncbi:MAG: hypothetical protein EBU31_00505 [Proteobacteria bacterium]|nr:hypothetical protein [Pseudomonadota bacterium]
MTHVFASIEEAEAASNQMYKVMRPEGTTELWYGWLPNPDGEGYILSGMDERWALVDGKWILEDK